MVVRLLPRATHPITVSSSIAFPKSDLCTLSSVKDYLLLYFSSGVVQPFPFWSPSFTLPIYCPFKKVATKIIVLPHYFDHNNNTLWISPLASLHQVESSFACSSSASQFWPFLSVHLNISTPLHSTNSSLIWVFISCSHNFLHVFNAACYTQNTLTELIHTNIPTSSDWLVRCPSGIADICL